MSKTELILVLVEPLYDRNIGSISRVMSNFGVDKLILINRQCALTYEAQLAAATGQEALRERTEYLSWADFLSREPEGALLAFSARDGRGRQTEELRSITQRFSLLEDFPRLYLVFGREDRGLSAADLEHCHFCAKLPVPGPNRSLNLSHAALMALHLVTEQISSLRVKKSSQDSLIEITNSSDPLDRQKELDLQLLKFLHSLGMNFENRRINAHAILVKLLRRAYPSRKESLLLQNILAQATRLITEQNKLRRRTPNEDLL